MFKLPVIPLSEDLIDKAFRQAAKAARIEKGKGKKQSREDRYLNAELARVKVAGSVITGDLLAVVAGFPSYDQMSDFHKQLFTTQVSLDFYRKSLGRIQGVGNKVADLKSSYMKKLKTTREPDKSRAFLGRAASMVKKINGELTWLVEVKTILKSFPTLKPDPTIVIAGYPNVGKSTFLRTLTKSKVKTAPYPFTTQSILIGYRKHRYIPHQLVDTPGLLDRPLADRNPIEGQAIAAIKHLAHAAIFIFDPTQEIEPQLNLYEDVREMLESPIVTSVNLKEDAEGEYPCDPVYFNALEERDCVRLFTECAKKIDYDKITV